MKMNTINAKTTLCAVFGDPIGHSLSPIMHNAAYAALGMDCVYVACRVESAHLAEAIRGIGALGMKGANITIPHKKAVISQLDGVFGDALQSGSVNTVVNRNRKLFGASTDGTGLVHSLQVDGRFEPAGKNVLLLGSGGAAPAVIYSLIAAGIESLTVINRDCSKAFALQAKVTEDTQFKMTVRPLEELAKFDLEPFDLLVNTTSVGLHDDTSLILPQQLHPGLFVYDIVYKKGDTRLIAQAEKAGCRFLSGLSLLLFQGAESFRIWFEAEPPIATMRKALEEACQG